RRLHGDRRHQHWDREGARRHHRAGIAAAGDASDRMMWLAGAEVTRRLRRQVPSLVLFAVLIIAWQLAVSVVPVRGYLFPSPCTVLRATFDFRIPWWSHIWITAAEIVGAFVVAGAVGILLGAAVAWSATLSSALVPFLVFVNTLPKVAVAPLFL